MRVSHNSVRIPPLVLIGTIIVLFPIFTFMTLDRISRQKQHSTRLLIEKSTALITAFEAAASTGMMNMGWNRTALETLLTQTAALPDIEYLFLVDRTGKILIHKQREKVGQQHIRSFDPARMSDDLKWREVTGDDGKRIFEVYKKFTPLRNADTPGEMQMPMMRHRMHQMFSRNFKTYEDTYIFIGLDMSLITMADKNDTRHTILMAVILAVIGFTGFILVFIANRYAAAKFSLSRMKIFSEALVANMPLGLIAVDVNGKLVSMNPAAMDILKINRKENFKTKIPRDLMRLMPSGPHHDISEKTLELEIAPGERIHLEIIFSPLLDDSRQSMGSLMIIRDITEINSLKAEVEQSKRLAAIGRLAAGVAHEIRNPLSSLKGYATFFKEIFDKDTENFSIADTMTREVDRLNRVVSELGELAKPVSVTQKQVDLEQLITHVIQQLAFEPDTENIEIEKKVESGLPHVRADEDRMRQVLLNLCLNGLQAIEGAGKLIIGATLDRSKQAVGLFVEDTGSGIPPEELDNIFEPYYTTKLSGTGLGLAIVHNIVKAHNGQIDVRSSPAGGTCFTVWLNTGD